jgi:hypothetical protein
MKETSICQASDLVKLTIKTFVLIIYPSFKYLYMHMRYVIVRVSLVRTCKSLPGDGSILWF